MRLVFMGTPEFAVPALRHLVLGGHEVVSVYTRPDRPAGRGLKTLPSPVKRAALSLGLTVSEPRSLKGEGVAQALRGLLPDAVVVAAYARLLPGSILSIPRYGCLNLHPSLLPRHRGPSPIPAAILAGDEFTGVSIMLMDEGLDTGPVLSQAQLPIMPDDTTGSLTLKLSEVAARLIVEVLPRFASGELSPCPQDNEKATYSGRITRESGVISWEKPAETLWREVRAYAPSPGAHTTFRGRMLKVLEAAPLPTREPLPAGKVVRFDYFPEPVAFGVAAGEGILGILRIQLEGRRAVTSGDFLRGQRDFLGTMLPS